MKKLAVLFGLLMLATGAFAQTPTIGSIVNGATYSYAPLPNSPIARGAIFIVFGSNMGPLNLQGASSLPLQTSLAGTSIRITAGSTNVQAPLLYVSSTQLAGILPSNTPLGSVNVTVTYNAGTSNSFTIQVVQSNFGAFTYNQAGSGAAVVLDGGGAFITALNPARPNQTVAVYGTGVGPISTDDAAAPPAGDQTNVPVEVYVGTTKAPLVYRGRAPGFAGLDQINFTIPPGNIGCSVSLLVKINNLVSNISTIAVSNGGPCSDTNGINFGQLTSRDSLKIGSVFLSHSSTTITLPAPIGPQTSTADSGSGYFVQVSRDSLSQSQASFGTVSVGGCSVSFFNGQSAAQSTFTTAVGLDAGTQLTVTGSNGSRTLPKLTQPSGLFAGLYGGALSIPPAGPFLGSGTYTVSVPGGADVGAFNTSIQGAPLTWTNSSLPAIDRTKDLLITWTGGQNSTALITGTSSTPVGNSFVSGSFVCLAPGAAGRFTVPAAVLLLLPPSSQQGSAGFTIPTGFLSVASYTVNAINPVPSGLDQAFSGYTDLTGVAQSYQ